MISFAEFLRQVYGGDREPYPWQARLAERCARGEPPSAIAVPTGAGKTTIVDALVWALAQQADRPAAERTVGVRIVWAIDRRILVDEVYEHAAKLAQRLQDALGDTADPLHDIGARLADLSGDVPLVATRWRGGLPDRPERCGVLQPQVITSTIAQIGSRLLFRGYGVGRRSLAIEAGLAGCDTMICLDEAHLAQPFVETVRTVRAHREASERGLALPGLRTIMLSATPSRDSEDVITIDDGDRAALGSRFTGEKSARLVEPEVGEREAGQVRRLAEAAADYVRSGSATVACVVNTVRRARAVFDTLRKELGEEADCALLVGPQRPVDRDTMLGNHRETLFEGKPGERPLVCVATQTFEVGLDADVVAMVTESASATALVQRLGRLNRRGVTNGQATIVRDEGSWLYAEDEPAAWEWLCGLATDDGMIDVSVAALVQSPPPLLSRVPCAATLTPEIVELLVQTAPRPAMWREPDPEVFLRDPREKPAAEVTVCWRSDLRPDLLGREFDEYRSMLLKLAPPQRQELITLSMTAARALLAARYPQSRSPAAAARLALSEVDVENAMLDSPVPDAGHDKALPFVVMRGEAVHRGTFDSDDRGADGADKDDVDPIWPEALRPGDVIVMPTKAGGVDENGLAPMQSRREPATDVAADLRPNGRPAPVRITPEALGGDDGSQLAQHRWGHIARECRGAEGKMVETPGRDKRAGIVDKLIERLRAVEPLADHGGLALLASDAPERVGWNVVLRSITAADPDGMPHLDDVDYGADDENRLLAAEEIEAGSEVDAEGVPEDAQPASGSGIGDESTGDASSSQSATAAPRALERVWVLLPVRNRDVESAERYLADERRPPTIDEHARAVSDEVRACSQRLQLAPELSSALTLAACAHDHGKADPRTQTFYRRGVHVLAAIPIAKSEFGTSDPRTERIAQVLAGMPRHQRHEIASVAVLDDALASGSLCVNGLDRDLALHNVGVHHGLGRPIPPVPEGGRPPRLFAIDAAGIAGSALGDGRDGWADGAWLERFWLMFERYGAWGMAYLEALLVLSDRVVSSRGE